MRGRGCCSSVFLIVCLSRVGLGVSRRGCLCHFGMVVSTLQSLVSLVELLPFFVRYWRGIVVSGKSAAYD